VLGETPLATSELKVEVEQIRQLLAEMDVPQRLTLHGELVLGVAETKCQALTLDTYRDPNTQLWRANEASTNGP